MPQKQIIAIGGAGFSAATETFGLESYLLAQTRAERPRVAFVPTASGDAESYIVLFYSSFARFNCRPSHLPFFQRTPDLRSYLLGQDVIYVGGGNTKSMLAVWRDWGMPQILREAWESGIVLAGTSAGAICWFEQGVTDSFAGSLRSLECLGFLAGSCCPHYDGEPGRRPAYHQLVGEGLSPGIALDDGVGAHYVGGELFQCVSSRAGAKAYRLSASGSAAKEEVLPVKYLGEA